MSGKLFFLTKYNFLVEAVEDKKGNGEDVLHSWHISECHRYMAAQK